MMNKQTHCPLCKNKLVKIFSSKDYLISGETFDIVLTFDEAITVTSAAWSADQVISNKLYFDIDNYGPTDMASDGGLKMQYYSGSGTNKLTFRGTIPNTAVAGGRLGHGTYTLATNGSSALVDGNGTAVTEGDLAGGSAIGGAAGNLLPPLPISGPTTGRDNSNEPSHFS